ncbi:MAG: hypothetical protein R6V04_15535 [bacterium]
MAKKNKKDDKNAGVESSNITFCTPRCEHAHFPEDIDIDGSKSCHTFSALWCDILEEYVTRNAPCPVKFGKRRPKSNW